MAIWLTGVEQYPILGCTGPNTFDGAPARVVLHTTECSWAAAMAVFTGNPCYTPHFLLDPQSGRLAQLVPLDYASAALANDPGGVETNREGAIQIEMVGNAHDTPGWSDAALRTIAALLVEIRRHVRFEWVAPKFYGDRDGFTVASKSAPQRMSPAAWRAFNGVCGHQHVPENEHWDPGHIDVEKILTFARIIEGGTSAPTPQEDDMPSADDLLDALAADTDKAKSVRAKIAQAATADWREFMTGPYPEASTVRGNIAAAVVAAQGGADAKAIAASLAEQLGAELGKAVADELAERLKG